MIRFERWSEEKKRYALAYLSTPLPNSVACKKDRIEAKRHCHNHTHIPKWKNISTIKQDTLYIPTLQDHKV